MFLNSLSLIFNSAIGTSNTAWLVWGGLILFALILLVRWLLSAGGLLKSADDDSSDLVKTPPVERSAPAKTNSSAHVRSHSDPHDDFTTLRPAKIIGETIHKQVVSTIGFKFD